MTITWTQYMDWQVERLHPVVRNLMEHKGQPYAGNVHACMHQACIRLMASEKDEMFAKMCLHELEREARKG